MALRDEGLTVTGFNIRAPTLDDVFLAITGHAIEWETDDQRSAGEPAIATKGGRATDGGPGR